jgi:lysophospholipase L1-like esterase
MHFNKFNSVIRSIQVMAPAFLAVPLAVMSVVAQQGADSNPAEKWEADIRQFEEQDRQSPPPQGGIVFAGSSSIRKWHTLQMDFPARAVIRRGFGGSQMADLLHYMDRIVLPYAPEAIVVYEGDNDLNSGKTVETVLEEYRQFCALVHQVYPECRIVFIAVKPSIARWQLRGKIRTLNSRIEEWSQADNRLGYADVYTPMLDSDGKPDVRLLDSDDLHLSPHGYQVWTRVVEDALSEVLNARPQ